jgi:hypothetical protein|tara:strand:+ start:376 stop:933 length:558 start_codon:yes stop_codon:yes gene_type:complete
MENEELLKRFRKMNTEYTREEMPYFIIKHYTEWKEIIYECGVRKIVEVYDEMIKITDDFVSEVLAMGSANDHQLLSMAELLRAGISIDIAMEALKMHTEANKISAAKSDDDVFYNALGHNFFLHPLNDLAIYFKLVWSENQDSLDMEKPKEILERSNQQSRAVHSTLVTFGTGNLQRYDSAGGLI